MSALEVCPGMGFFQNAADDQLQTIHNESAMRCEGSGSRDVAFQGNVRGNVSGKIHLHNQRKSTMSGGKERCLPVANTSGMYPGAAIINKQSGYTKHTHVITAEHYQPVTLLNVLLTPPCTEKPDLCFRNCHGVSERRASLPEPTVNVSNEAPRYMGSSGFVSKETANGRVALKRGRTMTLDQKTLTDQMDTGGWYGHANETVSGNGKVHLLEGQSDLTGQGYYDDSALVQNFMANLNSGKGKILSDFQAGQGTGHGHHHQRSSSRGMKKVDHLHIHHQDPACSNFRVNAGGVFSERSASGARM